METTSWQQAITAMYTDLRESRDPNNQHAADRLLGHFPFLEPDRPPLPAGLAAYREAAHYCMAFLIRPGYTEGNVPLDRSDILPIYPKVTLEYPGTDWDQTTGNLGSMATVAQVLLAGVVAERICYTGAGRIPPLYSPLVSQAKGHLLAYLEEYRHGDEDACVAGANAWLDSLHGDEDACVAGANAWLDSLLNATQGYIEKVWPAVEEIAQVMLQRQSLPANQADAIIASHLSEHTKYQAQQRIVQANARWRA